MWIIKRFLKEDSGNIWALMLLFLPIFLIMVGLVFDYGRVVVAKQLLQNVVDSAAISGANIITWRESDRLYVPTNPNADANTSANVSINNPNDLSVNSINIAKTICDKNLIELNQMILSGSSNCVASIEDDVGIIIKREDGSIDQNQTVTDGAIKVEATIKLRMWFLPIFTGKSNQFTIFTTALASPTQW